MMQRFGEPVRAGQRYKLRPGAYAIIPREGNLLLTHQTRPASEFQLPGGGIDPGESNYQALRREVFEETGWSLSAIRKLGAYRRFVYMPEYDLWAEKVAHMYVAFPVRAHGDPTEPGHTAVWSSVENAIEILASDGDRAFVAKFMR